MKAVSLSLKIVAILAAAFCVYAWVDTRGKIKSAEMQMQDVEGQTLSEKAANIPVLLKNNEDLNQKVVTFEKRVATLEKRGEDLNKELESERSKNVQANTEIAKKNGDIRTLNASIETFSKQSREKDATIEALRREIIDTKNLLAEMGDIDSLKDKIQTLESQLDSRSKELEDAKSKITLLEQGEVMEVVETDAAGNKIIRKIAKLPYIAKGDIATVLDVDQKLAVVQLNRGSANELQEGQKINLKREGRFVAEIIVDTVAENTAVALFNRGKGIPETIETGDLLELGAVAFEEPESGSSSAPALTSSAPSQQEEAPEDVQEDIEIEEDFDF